MKNKAFSFLIFVIIAVTIAILSFMWLNLSSTIESLARNQISETSDKVSTRLDEYFSSIRENLIHIKQLTDYGLMDAEDKDTLNYLLFPIFNTSPHITTFALARSNGDEFSLLREDSTWLNNFVYETDSGMNILRHRWKGTLQSKSVVKDWYDYNAGYDPRTRDWFKGAASAQDPDSPYWTNPYKILFQTMHGITAAMKAKSKLQGAYNIVQFDILLSDISELTRNLSFSENGRVFILSEKEEVIGLPNCELLNHIDTLRKYVLVPWKKVPNEAMTYAMEEWKELGDEDVSEAYNFNLDGDTWWASVMKYELDNNRYFLIGVIVPEKDFLAEVKRSRNIILACGILVLIFILIVAKGYFDKKKANRILFEQKEEIETQKEEIETQKEEIEAQRDLLVEQKEQIELINEEMTASIQYARRIQAAILPSAEAGFEIFPEHFVMYRPRDIVSGDFYWMSVIEGQKIICVADCTGHGVPGAFMSMLGVSFLNEIVNKEYITHTGVILQRLRKQIVRSLQQRGQADFEDDEDSYNRVKDGMDLAICSINEEKMLCQFSGANNPAYLLRETGV
ncbi:MAG: hypothetical protein C0594_08190, partial [Marinilabiliales bacterium]